MKAPRFVGYGVLVLLFPMFSERLAYGEESAPVAADPVESMCRCAGPASPAAARIAEILAEPLKSTGLDFTEEPLENVVSFLQSEYQIPIQLDEPALDDAGLTRDEKVTISIQNVSLRSALRLLLKRLQLTYVIRDEVLVITTPEEAESELVVCVYDVRDLIGARNDAKQLKSIVDVIASCVAVETWAVNGKGAAEIKSLPSGLLVVSQTQAVHEQIGDLLRAIRETLRQSNAASPAGESAAPNDDLFGVGSEMGRSGGYGRGGYGMEGGEMGVEGRAEGMGGGRGGYGEGYGDRGCVRQPKPTPAGGMNPFD